MANSKKYTIPLGDWPTVQCHDGNVTQFCHAAFTAEAGSQAEGGTCEYCEYVNIQLRNAHSCTINWNCFVILGQILHQVTKSC